MLLENEYRCGTFTINGMYEKSEQEFQRQQANSDVLPVLSAWDVPVSVCLSTELSLSRYRFVCGSVAGGSSPAIWILLCEML